MIFNIIMSFALMQQVQHICLKYCLQYQMKICFESYQMYVQLFEYKLTIAHLQKKTFFN